METGNQESMSLEEAIKIIKMYNKRDKALIKWDFISFKILIIIF